MSEDAGLFSKCDKAIKAAGALLEKARLSVIVLVCDGGDRINATLLEEQQLAAHGYAWLATYVSALENMLIWGRRLQGENAFGETESLILRIAFGEYLSQMSGGIALSQVEIVRPSDLGLDADAVFEFQNDAVLALISEGNTTENRKHLAACLVNSLETRNFGALGLGDETLEMVRDQFQRFADDHADQAHDWHLKDELIPIEVVEQLAELGIFGLTVPEEYGGLGMGKAAMCVVTEELSRGYIGLGSLGTRSEIAAELIRLGGTKEQKQQWLPRISIGEILPTAVFTEPNTGSDLGSLKTRAVKEGDIYRITGNKTWITHAARSDIMTLLVRTNPDEPGYKGLSMFIAEKPRGTDDDDFPAEGMSGSEIKVLGYRGMKEYELGFDGFAVKAENLLGAEEGQGFKQLMATFESARIQTAARAVGVAQCALELGMRYAQDRIQFGKPLYSFPRVFGKLVWMTVETMVARQLTYAAAREKDSDRRCDIEAGMAKLLGARVAWSNADNALQIHGGNGYAEEYKISRILCDARILNIFEGAAEIQAQVIARGLLSGRN
ncbi:acyl-CoA dehydrogenase family protein [Kiloniella antarctica]|uniref:Acyl-CoA dehydrogenase family protein n=1 Tax=Kiloniella antarctica TaxID=1550907 RepID=A0ABW5BFS3_9PROT